MVGPWTYLSGVCYTSRASGGFTERNTFIRGEMDQICVLKRTPYIPWGVDRKGGRMAS